MSGRLDAVLRVRRLQERRARGQVAMDRRRHRLADEAERRTWDLLDGQERSAPVLIRAGDALGRYAMRTAGVLAAETQHTATEQAAVQAEASVQNWTVAARRVEGLERLAERLAALVEEDRQRAAANEVDDLVLARFGRDDDSTGRGAWG